MVNMNQRSPELKETWAGSAPSVVGMQNVLIRDVNGNVAGQSAGITTMTEAAVTVGVASGTALAANSSRVYALFINDSDTTIYLSTSAAAAVNTGIRLNANGGSYEMTGLNLYKGIVRAIASGANKTLLVLEGV